LSRTFLNFLLLT